MPLLALLSKLFSIFTLITLSELVLDFYIDFIYINFITNNIFFKTSLNI